MACATATPDFRFTGHVTVKFFHLGGSNDPPSSIRYTRFARRPLNSSSIKPGVCSISVSVSFVLEAPVSPQTQTDQIKTDPS
jgi:hypothetical protein